MPTPISHAAVGFASHKGDAKIDQAMRNLGTGQVSAVWAYQGSKPFLSRARMYSGLGDTVHCVNPESKEVLWKKKLREGAEELLDGFLTPLGIPCQRPPYGFLAAVDLKGGKLLWTGQFRAVCSSTSRCGESGGNGRCTSEGNPTIRRGASFDISFFTCTVIPRRSTPRASALIPIVVVMQVPSAVATRSVGEKLSPFPRLSVGASVEICECDGPWVASQ